MYIFVFRYNGTDCQWVGLTKVQISVKKADLEKKVNIFYLDQVKNQKDGRLNIMLIIILVRPLKLNK